MNAVMISIRPEWCEKILSGKKTVEIRKTRPNLQTPFKTYIYCTQPKIVCRRLWRAATHFYCDDRSHNGPDRYVNGKVLAEFTCNRVDWIQKRGINNNYDYCYESLNIFGNDDIETEITDISKSCIRKDDLNEYGKSGRSLYAWHISELKTYDKPKDICEFWQHDKESDCSFGYLWENGGNYRMNRAPQSWCYVEEWK